MAPKPFTRRTFLKVAGAIGTAVTGLLQAGKSFAEGKAARPDGLEHFRGEIITRSNPGYLGWFWAMVWYRIKAPRYPALIAQPTDKDDLKLLLAYAGKANLQVTLRSSGHNISMPCLRQDAITVDMSLFTNIEVAAESEYAWAGPGVLSENLNRALYAKGYSFPSAHTGFVTIGGYLLGGGMGWNMPKWGMGCASVIGAELMLASGDVVTVSEHENADLFWALRGVGPGFFAVVLRYKLRVYKSPKIVKNSYFFGLDKLEAAAKEMVGLLPVSAQRTEVLCALGNFPPPGAPKDDWYWAVSLMSYGDTEADAKEAAKVFRESKLPSLAVARMDDDQPLNYMDLYTQLHTDDYAEYRTTELALFTDEPGKVVSKLGERLSREALDSRSFGFCVLGTNPTVPEPCSFTYSAPHYVSWYLIGKTDEDVKANYKLLDELHEDLKPYIKGYYINEIDIAHDPSLARKCFSEEKWNKLQAVRARYDPAKHFVGYVSV